MDPHPDIFSDAYGRSFGLDMNAEYWRVSVEELRYTLFNNGPLTPQARLMVRLKMWYES